MIYDLEVARKRLEAVRKYAAEHSIRVIDIFVHPDLKSVYRVRFSFPRGTFAAFQREFACFVIKKLD